MGATDGSMFDLSGKVALVTGAYRGLGFAIAQGLARAGATVVLNGRKQDALDAAAEKLRTQNLAVDTTAFDVTDRAAIDKSVAAIAGRHGSIDILFNNAGIQRRGAFTDFPMEQWDEVIATNLTAPFAMSQAVLPGMIAKEGRQDRAHRLADERAGASHRRSVHGRQGRCSPAHARHGGRARAA